MSPIVIPLRSSSLRVARDRHIPLLPPTRRLPTAPAPGFLPRRLALVAGWELTAGLLFAVPDVRLMRDFAYLVAGGAGFVDRFDWPAANQIICLAGGLLCGEDPMV